MICHDNITYGAAISKVTYGWGQGGRAKSPFIYCVPNLVAFKIEGNLLAIHRPTRHTGGRDIVPAAVARGGAPHRRLHDALLRRGHLLRRQERPPRHPRRQHEGDQAHAVPWGAQGLGEDAGEDDGGENVVGLMLCGTKYIGNTLLYLGVGSLAW